MAVATIGNNTGNTYSGIQDNRLDQGDANNNYGTHTRGYTGFNGTRIMRELHRWNLTSIPAGATCSAASLFLYDTNWGNRTADCTVTLYKVADANGTWVEGTVNGTTETGSPCYNKKVYNTVNWAGSVGCGSAGTDYVNTSLGSATFTDGVSGYREIQLNAAGLTVLESWFGQATNNGIVIIGTGSDSNWTEFESSQGTDTHRPYLSVTYSSSVVKDIIGSGFIPFAR